MVTATQQCAECGLAIRLTDASRHFFVKQEALCLDCHAKRDGCDCAVEMFLAS